MPYKNEQYGTHLFGNDSKQVRYTFITSILKTEIHSAHIFDEQNIKLEEIQNYHNDFDMYLCTLKMYGVNGKSL